MANIKKQNILIVDDRPENLMSLEAMLEDFDINIIRANSGDEALDKVLDYDFSLILLDVQMPVMDGFEVAELIRGMKKTKDIPIIFVTAISKDQKYAFKGYEIGAVDYIHKPIDAVVLESKIRVFLKLHEQKMLLDIKAKELEERVRELEEVKSELEESNRLLSHLSSHDGLTGILNRRSFDEVLDRVWRRCARDNSEVALILIDVDYFKKYNDIYGHLKGDSCLKLLASTIGKMLNRPGDFVARYGGEEFVVILTDTNVDGALEIGKKIKNQIQNLGIEHKGSDISDIVTISLGVSHVFPDKTKEIENFINSADEALYQAKNTGRNRVCILNKNKLLECSS